MRSQGMLLPVPLLLLLLAVPPLQADPAVERLVVKGSQLINSATGKQVRLTGFNWPLQHVHSGDGDFMRRQLPGANVARIVGLLWDNSRVGGGPGDCLSNTPPYITDKCFQNLDAAIKSATDAGIWVILTCRSKYGAGQDYASDPETDVFHNTTLRKMFFTMWGAVASRYSSHPKIAAYEIMSEPRDKAASPETVRVFYESGCAAVHAIDPKTPCMVGPGSYYKLWNFGPDIILRNNTNVIYTFDFFQPEDWSFGRSTIPSYPGTYTCGTMYPGWVHQCCPKGQDAPVSFNASWGAQVMRKWALPVRDSMNVPIFINQWSVVYGVSAAQGRYIFMEDIARLLQTLDIGWAWWVWRGGNNGGSGWSHGSSEFVFYLDNGTALLDRQALAAVGPFMSHAD